MHFAPMTDNADPAQCAAEAAAALPRLCALQRWLAACLRLESNVSSPEASEQVQRAAHIWLKRPPQPTPPAAAWQQPTCA